MAPGEEDDSSVPKVTFEPKAPEVETLMAPPVPVSETVLMTGEPTAPPLSLKKPGVLLTLRPRTVLSSARSTPLPAVVVTAGAAPVEEAKVV